MEDRAELIKRGGEVLADIDKVIDEAAKLSLVVSRNRVAEAVDRLFSGKGPIEYTDPCECYGVSYYYLMSDGQYGRRMVEPEPDPCGHEDTGIPRDEVPITSYIRKVLKNDQSGETEIWHFIPMEVRRQWGTRQNWSRYMDSSGQDITERVKANDPIDYTEEDIEEDIEDDEW